MNSSPTTQRGLVLLEQGRYPEAEKYFRETLATDPHDPLALYHLAVCQLNQKQVSDALATINRALAVLPEAADFHTLRTFIFLDSHRGKEALASSDEALRLEPDSDFAWTARAAVFLARNEWCTAEAAARKALELNPENNTAANQLAHALRLQNRLHESAGQTAYMLSQDPESADNHSAAGWTALQSGDHREAERHFLEALRLNPRNEGAKEGLKEAFRARSPIYRAYLNYCFFMQRFTSGKQWLVIIGLLFAVRFARSVLPGPLALCVVVAYFLFVLWVHVARAVGNLQLCFDKFARHALDTAEKLEAWLAGGGVVLGLPLFLAGIFAHQSALLIIGLTLIGAAFPLSYTFTNHAKAGRIVFGLAAIYIYAIGLLNLAQNLSGTDFGSWLATGTGVASLVAILVTWVANLPVLNRRH